VHIDGAKAKQTKLSTFNQGTLPYELIIRSNTIINTLGNFDLKSSVKEVQLQLVNFHDIPEHLNSCICKYSYVSNTL